MLKIFTLAAAVAIIPVTGDNDPSSYNNTQHKINIPYFLNLRTAATPDIFEPEKKSAEPWSQNWMAAAQENISKSEYHFTWQEKLNAYCTPNRKNNLRFFYTDKGFTVEPRTTKIPIGEFDATKLPDEIKYRSITNWKVNFGLDKRQIGKGTWKVTGNNAEYITNNITVQYINNEEGMRQNFIVHRPLSKNGALKINLRIKTKLKTVLKNNRLEFLHKKNIVLNYKDLKVWDATGKSLSASFRLRSNFGGQVKKNNNGKYVIQVDAKDAVYPITIDPISTTPSAFLESNQANANMGTSVASAGDVNGDGYSDVIVGAYHYDNGELDEGRAFVYHGSATGINTVAAVTMESNQGSAGMGISVATAGDVNGDGYSDVIVGAYQYGNGQIAEGAGIVYQGSATGINPVVAGILDSNQAFSYMGFSVASAGDVNGDGYSDVIVGAHQYDNGEADEGAAFVYHGSATGINTTAAAFVECNQAVAVMGFSVASAGDVNGDGYSDVVVGAAYYDNGEANEGAAFVYLGSMAGINTTASALMESNQLNALLGMSVACAGDANGDGYSDVIAGVAYYDNGEVDEGAAFVYHGSASGINTPAAATIESNHTGAFMGMSVASAGDINGDGYSDAIVGAYRYDNGQTDEGAAFVYYGSEAGINITAVATLESNQANAYMGVTVASAGDVNGDGYSDVIVGASQFDNVETNEGAAFVYHGSATGINTDILFFLDCSQEYAQTGWSVASAGDVNGDGYSDVIVGAPLYAIEGAAFVYHGSATGINTAAAAMLISNQAEAWMSISVASAGDVNSDGYCDVIVGANGYDNDQTDEGAAFVYHGSPTGINTSPATMVECNQVNAHMGVSVASAGDVNGDGYSDVIVGATGYDNGHTDEGAAFVYHGSPTGINTTPAAIVESNQADARMGTAASAGDVNGDGYSDVIVGATGYDNGHINEGAAFVYHGSPTGINTSSAAMLECNQVGAFMGSVASAGDVNGDGYSDVIVGAQLFDNGHTDEGAAFVYHGSPTGINTSPGAMVESNQAGAYMGVSVASAGDTNGDGYSDVIVGADWYDNSQINEGVAFVYHGSPTGINTSHAAMVENNQALTEMGHSVASAGDVNGDGYSDVIVGAPLYDNALIDGGGAFVYHGNSPGTNKRNNLRLYNSDLSTPINSSNFIFGNFGAGLFAKSFLGRSKGKMVWETRLNYNAYSGVPITNSTFFTAQQASYADLGIAGIELKNLISKINGGRYTKLRARIKYDPVTAITGQVYSPWRNVSSIIDANNLGVLPVDLISFTASWIQKGKTARLDFKTDKESGICCFEIEKSADGFHFFTIGTLPAKNVSGIQSYSFIDNNATGKKQFYRLKIKGISGQVDYSNIQQLSAGSGGQNSGAIEILVFPNPTADVLQLQLNNSFDKMDVQIINSAGQIVKQMQLVATNQTITIPVQDLTAGKYWLRLQTATEKQVLQFIKQ